MRCGHLVPKSRGANPVYFNQQELVNSGGEKEFPRVVRFGRPNLKKEALRDPAFGPTFHSLQVPLSRVDRGMPGMIHCAHVSCIYVYLAYIYADGNSRARVIRPQHLDVMLWSHPVTRYESYGNFETGSCNCGKATEVL